jgi:D-3-phosphoglycerate dehydrogenase
VAEHTLAFICALSKDLKVNDLEVHKGNYGIRNTCKAFEFLDKNLGLIGFGNIGKEVAKLCSSIGLNVSVYDPLVSSETVENEGYKFINNLDELISESDIITVHVPLVEETRGLIGLNEFSLMKTNVIIVNCARGGIVDQAALTEALENKTIGGVGLDVFASEPLDEDDPILKFDNVITTPHIAGLTKEAFYSMSKMVADGVESILSGKQWPYVANKEVYKCKKWKE